MSGYGNLYRIIAKDLKILNQATGDIIRFNGTNWVRLGIGTVNQFLRVIAGLPSWQTVTIPAANVFSVQNFELTASFSTTSGVYVDTGITLTTANRAGGIFHATAHINIRHSVVNGELGATLVVGGTRRSEQIETVKAAGSSNSMGFSWAAALTGVIVKIQARIRGVAGTLTIVATNAGLETDVSPNLSISESS